MMLDASRHAPRRCQLEIATNPAVNGISDKAHSKAVAFDNVKGTLSLSCVSRGAFGVDCLNSERIAPGGWQVDDGANRGRITQFVIRVT